MKLASLSSRNFLFYAGALSLLSSCAFLGVQKETKQTQPIDNPFGDFSSAPGNDAKGVILRTSQGKKSFEVELTGQGDDNTSFEAPTDQLFGEIKEKPSADRDLDNDYKNRKPTMADREIARTFPKAKPDEEWKRREIENSLGLVESDQETPESTQSYLSGLDHVKQLYRKGRYEAALIEVDQLIQQYPTNPKLYSMRGTLLDRLGYEDLAIRSWSQALEFEPSNKPLERFLDRKKKKRKWKATASQ